MKIIFFGSDNFALVHLRALIASENQIMACVTQPDRPKGRGMKVVFSDIKKYAMDNHIPLLQPYDLRDNSFIEKLKEFRSDLFVVIAYGKFLTEELLNIPKIFSINVHGSLLPQYRGAAPINWAIIKGEQETGLSIIKMNAKMDAGDILAIKKIEIKAMDTAVTLREKMMDVGPDFLVETIRGFLKEENISRPVIQKDQEATYAPKLTKELGRIDWRKKAVDIHNLIRGLLPRPAAYVFFKNKSLKILESEVIDLGAKGIAAGEVVEVKRESFTVAAADGAIAVKRVQMESCRPMDVESFLLGHRIEVGMKFQIET